MDFNIFLKNYKEGQQYYEQSHCDYDTGRDNRGFANLNYAADCDYPPAHLVLGRTLKNEDYNKALEQFTLGARKGELSCQYELVLSYFKGMGCQTNYEDALIWGTLYLEKSKNDEIKTIVDQLKANGVKYDEKKYFRFFQEIEEYREYEAHVKALEEEEKIKSKLNDIQRYNKQRKKIRKFEQKYGSFIHNVYIFTNSVFLVNYDPIKSDWKFPYNSVLYINNKPIVITLLPCLSQDFKERIEEFDHFGSFSCIEIQLKSNEGKKFPPIFQISFSCFGEQKFSENIYFKLQEDGMNIIFCGNNESSERFEEVLKKKYNCELDWATAEYCYNPDL